MVTTSATSVECFMSQMSRAAASLSPRFFLPCQSFSPMNPPCERYGGALNIHLQSWSSKNFSTEELSILERILSYLHAPTKLVLRSEQMSLTGPPMVRKCLKAFIKLDVLRVSMSSMWMALMLIQVNSTAHRLL